MIVLSRIISKKKILEKERISIAFVSSNETRKLRVDIEFDRWSREHFDKTLRRLVFWRELQRKRVGPTIVYVEREPRHRSPSQPVNLPEGEETRVYTRAHEILENRIRNVETATEATIRFNHPLNISIFRPYNADGIRPPAQRREPQIYRSHDKSFRHGISLLSRRHTYTRIYSSGTERSRPGPIRFHPPGTANCVLGKYTATYLNGTCATLLRSGPLKWCSLSLDERIIDDCWIPCNGVNTLIILKSLFLVRGRVWCRMI